MDCEPIPDLVRIRCESLVRAVGRRWRCSPTAGRSSVDRPVAARRRCSRRRWRYAPCCGAPRGSSHRPKRAHRSRRRRPRPRRQLDWTSCGDRMRCATLEVPLDYNDPTGRTITLSLESGAGPEARRSGSARSSSTRAVPAARDCRSRRTSPCRQRSSTASTSSGSTRGASARAPRSSAVTRPSPPSATSTRPPTTPPSRTSSTPRRRAWRTTAAPTPAISSPSSGPTAWRGISSRSAKRSANPRSTTTARRTERCHRRALPRAVPEERSGRRARRRGRSDAGLQRVPPRPSRRLRRRAQCAVRRVRERIAAARPGAPVPPTTSSRRRSRPGRSGPAPGTCSVRPSSRSRR